jgi:LmbE family N-acetylglucosaminyl deacetylase
VPDEGVERILMVTAHPDDVDFGAGGTIAGWTAAGVEVAYCIVTDGDAGGFDPDVPRDRIPGIRRDEQRTAAAELGVSDVTFLGYPDGRLEVSLDLRRDIARQIRRFRPQRVVTQTPYWSWRSIYRSHPDHRAAGEAALSAVYPDARNPFTFMELRDDEGLEAWTVPETWIMVDELDGVTPTVVDVTDTIDRKLAALRAHVSQVTDPAALEDRVRTWLGDNARRHGLPEGRYAEVFSAVDTR